MNDARQPNRSCPYLGLMDDANTSSAFPSIWNTCHHSDPIAPPRFKHQEEFCLSEKHGQCPLFLSPQAMPMSEDLRIPLAARDNSRRNYVVALTVFIVVLIFGWGIARHGPSSPPIGKATWTALSSKVPGSTVTSAPAMSASMTYTITRIPSTRTPPSNGTTTPTSTPTVTPSKHQYDVLIGTDYKFVIHIVSTGENLDQLASKYGTSEEAIVIINYFQSNPGWSGTQLVIPVGFTDVASLPSFVVYQVTEKDRGSSVEDIAKKLRVSALDLRYYNGWTDAGDRPLVGDLLLIPRPRPLP